MRRLLVVCAFIGITLTPASAQGDDQLIFNHLGIGISVGTTAIGINASTVLTPYLGIRAGINIWPMFKLHSGLHLRLESDGREPGACLEHLQEVNQQLSEGEWVPPSISDLMDVKVKVLPKLTAGHLLIDYYPFPYHSNFHITAGAHIGTGTVVDLHNRYDGILMPITIWNQALAKPEMQPMVEEYNLRRVGVALGDYFIVPDENGNIDARIRVSGFRPYLGLGFGRAVPRRRVGCQFDLGVQFWGSPHVVVNGETLQPDKVGDQLDDILSIASRIKVFPVLTFRLVGRIF